MASPRIKVTLPEFLSARIESIRESHAVGGVKPPRASVIRAAIEAGIGAVEKPVAPHMVQA
jgi:metal-responsive CopG/Arc/MetJ family transcriptional regulator